MQYFKLNALSDYRPVEPQSALLFEAPRPRRVKFQIVTNGPVEVWASPKDDDEVGMLVAFGSGQMSVEFGTAESVNVFFAADKDTDIFIKGGAADQIIAARDVEKYTSIEPRGARNVEMDRMTMIMRYNEMQREAQLAQEREHWDRKFAEMQAEISKAAKPEPTSEPKPKPEPKPEPNPEPKPEPKGDE